MKSDYTIRPMQLEDALQVHSLESAIYPHPWSLKSFRFEIENNKTSRPWVVVLDDPEGPIRVLAYIVAWQIIDEIHIANLAVHVSYRRQGLAKELIRKILNLAILDGINQACLEVRAGNFPAQTLYQEFGFEPTGLRKNYYQDTREDAIIMCNESLNDSIFLKAELL